MGIGLAGANVPRLPGEEKDHVLDAVSFIYDLRQIRDLSNIPVGRHVVVIGGE